MVYLSNLRPTTLSSLLFTTNVLHLYKKKDNNKHTYYFFDFLLSKKTNKTIFLFVISKKHFMKSIISDLTSETIGIIFKECEKDKNKKRLEVIMNNII